jgi:hypothetical protein
MQGDCIVQFLDGFDKHRALKKARRGFWLREEAGKGRKLK